jgi:general secretion pathway protein N
MPRLPASTGLLGAITLWGLGLLVLAVLGLGANVGPHPDDFALAPPLPAVSLVETRARLGPLSRYSEVAERPLL